MKILLSLSVFSLILCGCGSHIEKPAEGLPIFTKYYNKATAKSNSIEQGRESLPPITISARNMPLRSFLRIVAEQSGVSIITDESLDDKLISFEVDNIDGATVLAALAKKLNVAISKTGKLYHIGAIRPEDRAIFITKCVRLSAENIKAAIEVVMSKDGKCISYEDGLLIIADKAELINKIADLLERIEAAPIDTWVVQYQIVTYTETAQKSLGISAGANFGLATTAAEDNTDSSVSADINAAIDSGKAKLIAEPLMLLEDGTTAEIKDGETIPIPEKTVSPEGTITTTGVTYQESGLQISTYIKDMGGDYARLKIQLGINTATGYIENYPIMRGQSSTFETAIRTGQPYLVCNISQDFTSKNRSGGIQMTADKQNAKALLTANADERSNNSLMQIWVRAYKVNGMEGSK